MPKNRIEAFTDAVMAIVMTILVLDLRAPELPDGASLHDYWVALAPLWPKFVSFALTFAIIAVFWVGNYYFIHRVRQFTPGLVWLNFLFLFWICLLPFPTQFLGAHPFAPFPVFVYALCNLMASTTVMLMRRHVARAGLFENEDSARLDGPRQSLPGIILCLLALSTAVVNVYVSVAFLLLIPVLYFVPWAWRWAAKPLRG